MNVQPAVDPPRRRAGEGDHERALRVILDGSSSDRRLLERVQMDNRIVLHNYTGSVCQKLTCAHPACGAEFDVTLVPGQIVYPKWCPEHRTAHRRRDPEIPDRAGRAAPG